MSTSYLTKKFPKCEHGPRKYAMYMEQNKISRKISKIFYYIACINDQFTKINPGIKHL